MYRFRNKSPIYNEGWMGTFALFILSLGSFSSPARYLFIIPYYFLGRRVLDELLAFNKKFSIAASAIVLASRITESVLSPNSNKNLIPKL